MTLRFGVNGLNFHQFARPTSNGFHVVLFHLVEGQSMYLQPHIQFMKIEVLLSPLSIPSLQVYAISPNRPRARTQDSLC
ncbi:hypothetical protein EUGRSUZ_C00893 [Eucalyptus grandis]|uniref:Uncharacterized protein n=2 Tax=Eucalyptus grandis TaxID=71139 RepID=A0ACC3LBA5_EUCGR|nr:hypothetical protein EUGRSUZ_C00893 [Eucalyptus grandis]